MPAPAPGGAAEYKVIERSAGGDASAPLVAAGVAGLYVPISPYRTWDSRDFVDGKLISLNDANGQAIALDILVDQDGILAIPETATAITYNVTIVNQTSAGFLTVSSVLQPPSEAIRTSTVNWSGPGGAIANGSAVAVNVFEGEPGYIGVMVGGPGATTDFIIDVTGYYIAVPA